MLRKVSVGVLIFILSVLVLSAQEIIVSDGVLTAEGDGTVALNGNGTVTLSGKGMLFVVDRTGETMIDIDNVRRYFHVERQTRGNTAHTYHRFNGTATISGEDMAIIMQGINIQVSVSGTGMMLLEGIGDYTIGEDTADWSSDGVMINLGTFDP